MILRKCSLGIYNHTDTASLGEFAHAYKKFLCIRQQMSIFLWHENINLRVFDYIWMKTIQMLKVYTVPV